MDGVPWELVSGGAPSSPLELFLELEQEEANMSIGFLILKQGLSQDSQVATTLSLEGLRHCHRGSAIRGLGHARPAGGSGRRGFPGRSPQAPTAPPSSRGFLKTQTTGLHPRESHSGLSLGAGVSSTFSGL